MTETAREVRLVGELGKDAAQATERFAAQRTELAALPPKPERTEAQRRTADELLLAGQALREQFMRLHAGEIYAELTDGYHRLLRVTELAYAAARAYPGLVPTREEIDAERRVDQKHKEGLEIDQGIFVAHVLDDPRSGYHLLHAMSQPRQDARDRLDEFLATDRVDLGTCSLQRSGEVGYLTIHHYDYLNAEDDESTAAMEAAVDLVLLDDRIEVGVLRGAPAQRPKWAGRRVFDTGVNLTKLYDGQVSLIEFFIERELGLLSKWYRGHSTGDGAVTELEYRTEKPWVAVVDAFAIGGGCQFLLVMDRVVAQRDAYLSLPARREGFIPGCANLRLPRFVGEGLTRQGIFFNRDIPVDTLEGRMIADDVVDTEEQTTAAVDEAVEALTSSGPVGVVANRTLMRSGPEPLDAFRRYMANLSRHQAFCMYSPAIIRNLELMWDPQRRARR